MAFLAPRQDKKLIQGEFIVPSALIWEDINALRVVSATYPLPVNVVAGGGGGGGLSQIQVRSSGNIWTDVGYSAGNLNMPVQVQTALPPGANTIGRVRLVDPAGNEPTWADLPNNAIRVNVVAGGAGGGLSQLQVRNAANVWTDVGYYTDNLNLPVEVRVALPAGNNNIGDVDVVTYPGPAASQLPSVLTVAGNLKVAIEESITLTVQATDLDIRNLVPTQDAVVAKLATDAIHDGLTALTPKFAQINVSTAGNNTIVEAVVGKKIRVLQYALVCASVNTITWRSGVNTISGGMSFAANGGISAPFSPIGLLETATGEALVLNLSAAAAVGGHLVYIEV